jgi:8-hydroxy-5-deazaflavin:NADPH oxidoreductase
VIRGPESPASVASALGEGASAGTVEQASAAEIVAIAVPWDKVPEAVQGLDWNGQIVIDCEGGEYPRRRRPRLRPT